MLLRFVAVTAFAAFVATQIPALIESAPPAAPLSAPSPAKAEAPAAMPAANGSAFQIPADATGHYKGTFRINGKPVEGLIDTGATLVAVNETTARRLGFSGNGLDFAHPVNTANGQTKAALVTLDRIEIGGVKVRGVEALVLRDAALSQTLVGMSFLKKLGSYRVAGDVLELHP